ncbi:hypothetical protein C3B79_0693 [Aeromonas hydrophila]|nr:hypothetical protein C3B79_0693 [Aeromonas hydrophila]
MSAQNINSYFNKSPAINFHSPIFSRTLLNAHLRMTQPASRDVDRSVSPH